MSYDEAENAMETYRAYARVLRDALAHHDDLIVSWLGMPPDDIPVLTTLVEAGLRKVIVAELEEMEHSVLAFRAEMLRQEGR